MGREGWEARASHGRANRLREAAYAEAEIGLDRCSPATRSGPLLNNDQRILTGSHAITARLGRARPVPPRSDGSKAATAV